MKNQIAIASAFIAASSLSVGEIVINDFLSFEGFIDMSYSTYQADVDASVDGIGNIFDASESDNSFGLDQVEISWLFDFDAVTAQIDLQYLGNATDTGTDVEQAFATYHFGDDKSAITAGRYASMLGFEAFEPTGLYQYSFAYGLPMAAGDYASFSPIALPPVPGLDEIISAATATIFPLPGYSNGVKYTYDSDEWFFGASIQDGVYAYSGRLGGDFDADGGGLGVELASAFRAENGLTFFLGGAYEDGDGYSASGFSTGATDAWVLNGYVTYEVGAWVFAAEINYGQNEWDDVGLPGLDIETESLSGLLMANYAYSDKASVTGRVSYVTYELDGGVSGLGSGGVDIDMIKYTLAHSYAFSDNLLLVTEVSYSDGDAEGSISDGIASFGADADFDELVAAVELIFSF